MSRPEKSKQIFVHRQEKTRRWRHGYRKIGIYKDIVAAEYSENFSEGDQSRTSTVTCNFNYTSKDYINHISTDLSVEMVNTQNDGQNTDR